MPRARRVRELSTEAKIGKILILIGIIFQIVGIAAVFTVGSGMMGYWGMMNYGYGMMNWNGMSFGGLFYLVGLIQIAGLIAGIYAYKAAERNDYHNAGILAVVSSLLPPLQLIILVGGILCLASREAKK